MELETVSMMDDCQEANDELHTIRQEWEALRKELTEYIKGLRNPAMGKVAWRSNIADELEDIMRGE